MQDYSFDHDGRSKIWSLGVRTTFNIGPWVLPSLAPPHALSLPILWRFWSPNPSLFMAVFVVCVATGLSQFSKTFQHQRTILSALDFNGWYMAPTFETHLLHTHPKNNSSCLSLGESHCLVDVDVWCKNSETAIRMVEFYWHPPVGCGVAPDEGSGANC